MFALLLFSDSEQDQGDKSLTKKTSSGLEVTLMKVELVRERDDLNNVPIYRMGSWPPGAAGNGMKMLANAGAQVYVVRLGIKLLSEYKGGGLTIPTISDSDDNKYISKNTMLSEALLKDLSNFKAPGEQLECEFPFEVRYGNRVKQVHYGNITFELDGRTESAPKP